MANLVNNNIFYYTNERIELISKMFYKDLDVIIPTYNRAEYLQVALESICDSIATWRKTIIINNASTDNTLEVIENIKKKYPKRVIEVVTNEKNIGNAGNFKKTQEVASNKYTAVFHDDDAIHPEYIDKAMKIVTESDEDVVLVSGGANGLYNVNHENWYSLPNYYWKYPSDKNVFLQLILARPNFCCCIYKTSVYKSIEYKSEVYGKLHDIIFISEVCKKGTAVYLHGECVRWRQHLGSDSNTLKTGPFPKEIINVLLKLKEIHFHECKANWKSGFRRILFSTLLFNFAYFLYQWADLKRFVKWEEFKKAMIKEHIFNAKDYALFDKIIDLILNPCIRKLATKYMKKCYKTYEYRVGE